MLRVWVGENAALSRHLGKRCVIVLWLVAVRVLVTQYGRGRFEKKGKSCERSL